MVSPSDVFCFSERPGKRLLKKLDFSRKVKQKTQMTIFCCFLRRAKSNQKHAEGLCPLDSRGTVQSSAQACFL